MVLTEGFQSAGSVTAVPAVMMMTLLVIYDTAITSQNEVCEL